MLVYPDIAASDDGDDGRYVGDDENDCKLIIDPS